VDPVWIIAIVVVLTAIGTQAFWRGFHAALTLVLFATLILITIGSVVLSARWVWNGGSAGWCKPREVEAAEIAAGVPPRTLDFDEFRELLRWLPRDASKDQIKKRADAAGRQNKGCWWSWKSTNGNGF
jgi:hypothetical protein